MIYEITLSGKKTDGIVEIDDVDTRVIPGIQSVCTTTPADGDKAQEILDYSDSLPPVE